MTTEEFEYGFDVLYNNVSSNQAPGLTSYEKSVFLTKAQDEIVKAYFSPYLNKVQQGFDGNERRQIDFSKLMRTIEGTSVTPSISIHPGSNTGYYALPNDILLYINEILRVTRGTGVTQLTVVPLSYTEYNTLMSKPYKRPLKNQAWRLITNGAANSYTYVDYEKIASTLAQLNDGDVNTANVNKIYNAINGVELTVLGATLREVIGNVWGRVFTTKGIFENNEDIDSQDLLDVSLIEDELNELVKGSTVASSDTVVEIIPGPHDVINSYVVRYISRPTPIVLEDFTNEGVSINGVQTPQTCALDPILHEEILQRAVELAKAAYTGDLTSQLALGQASETNMGAVTRQQS